MNLTEIRPFIPSKDYEKSKLFYTLLGFSSEPAGDDLTIFTKNSCTLFLYKCHDEALSKSLMLQLIVADIDEAFDLVSKIDLDNIRHSEINSESWGKVVYLWGPSGELWHITELNRI